MLTTAHRRKTPLALIHDRALPSSPTLQGDFIEEEFTDADEVFHTPMKARQVPLRKSLPTREGRFESHVFGEMILTGRSTEFCNSIKQAIAICLTHSSSTVLKKVWERNGENFATLIDEWDLSVQQNFKTFGEEAFINAAFQDHLATLCELTTLDEALPILEHAHRQRFPKGKGTSSSSTSSRWMPWEASQAVTHFTTLRQKGGEPNEQVAVASHKPKNEKKRERVSVIVDQSSKRRKPTTTPRNTAPSALKAQAINAAATKSRAVTEPSPDIGDEGLANAQFSAVTPLPVGPPRKGEEVQRSEEAKAKETSEARADAHNHSSRLPTRSPLKARLRSRAIEPNVQPTGSALTVGRRVAKPSSKLIESDISPARQSAILGLDVRTSRSEPAVTQPLSPIESVMDEENSKDISPPYFKRVAPEYVDRRSESPSPEQSSLSGHQLLASLRKRSRPSVAIVPPPLTLSPAARKKPAYAYDDEDIVYE